MISSFIAGFCVLFSLGLANSFFSYLLLEKLSPSKSKSNF